MKTAYFEAFSARDRCSELLQAYRFVGFDEESDLFISGMTAGETSRKRLSRSELDQIYLNAQAEDLQADYQASLVVLFADDSLQRFASGV